MVILGGIPHERFSFIDRRNLETSVEIPFSTAVLGGKVDVQLLFDEFIKLKIPPGTKSGTRFQLRGKGVAGGSLIIVVNIEVPKSLEGKEKELIEELYKVQTSKI